MFVGFGGLLAGVVDHPRLVGSWSVASKHRPNPEPQVWARAPAGPNTQQLAETTRSSVVLRRHCTRNPNKAWMIDYPCKQAPKPDEHHLEPALHIQRGGEDDQHL